jgi:hypothetical protein
MIIQDSGQISFKSLTLMSDEVVFENYIDDEIHPFWIGEHSLQKAFFN